eukprot:2574680-Rhodomonas_salina.1
MEAGRSWGVRADRVLWLCLCVCRVAGLYRCSESSLSRAVTLSSRHPLEPSPSGLQRGLRQHPLRP